MAWSFRSVLLVVSLVPLLLAFPTFDSAQPQLSIVRDQFALLPRTSPSPWRKLRDSLIEAIWPGVQEHKKKYTRPGQNVLRNLRRKYADDVVLRFTIQTEEEKRVFTEASNMLYLDVWDSSKNWTDVRVKKSVLQSFLGLLPESLQTSHKTLIHDLATAIYDTYPSLSGSALHPWNSKKVATKGMHELFFDDYQPLSVIYPWLQLISSLFPHLTTLTSIGDSAEGRDIPALRIGSRTKPKPEEGYHTILITAGSHAREWISVSTAAFVAYDLLTRYGTRANPGVTKLLDHYDIIIVPVLNPDGYEFTWTTDRLWRKTRQDTGIPFCAGIDLDRAFSFNWNGQDDVDNPCTESYAGTHPLDAAEAKALSNWAKNATNKEDAYLSSFIDLHSYSQKVLYPYSYTCREQPTNLEDLEEVAIVLSKHFRLTTGHFYEVESACEGSVTLDDNIGSSKRSRSRQASSGSSGGSALDFFYAEHVKYAFQIKLRDTGTYGFLLPRENIVPAGHETSEAILGMGRWLLGNRGIEIEEQNGGDEMILQHADIDNENEVSTPASNQVFMQQTQAETENEWERVYDPDFELRRRR